MQTRNSFNPEVRSLLVQAGWYEGRNAEGTFALPSDVIYPEEISQILNEFGGLYVQSSGSGITLTRNSIDFSPADADRESSDDGIISDYSSLINKTLYPLGSIPDESLTLCVDLQGNAYMVGDYLYLVGSSFIDGISNILLGIRGKQLKESDLTWVS